MSKRSGFSLIELLIVLTITSIIFFFIQPFSSEFFATKKVQIVANEITNALQYAKIAALNRKERLILTPLSNVNDWSAGMALRSSNKLNPEIIHEWHWQYTGVSINWLGFQSRHYLLFEADMHHSALNGSFIIKSKTQQIKLIINRLGRIRVC